MCDLLYSEALPVNPPWPNSCLHQCILVMEHGGNYRIQRKPWTDMVLVKRKTRLSCRQELSNIFPQSKVTCILFCFENQTACSHVRFKEANIRTNLCLKNLLMSLIIKHSKCEVTTALVKWELLLKNPLSCQKYIKLCVSMYVNTAENICKVFISAD